jgi:hypothetical protein
MIRKQLKKIKPFVKFYRKYKPKKRLEPQEIRIVMDRETKSWIEKLPVEKMDVLEISGSKWKYLNSKFYENLLFPQFDICKSKTEKKYDLIIAEQVFEHLLFPYRAGTNVYEMLNLGGYFLITTPFLLRIHECPTDCTRWTPMGMKYFLNECGFELNNIDVDSWGNKSSVKSNLKDWRIYNSFFHSLKNQREFPIVVWALARK